MCYWAPLFYKDSPLGPAIKVKLLVMLNFQCFFKQPLKMMQFLNGLPWSFASDLQPHHRANQHWCHLYCPQKVTVSWKCRKGPLLNAIMSKNFATVRTYTHFSMGSYYCGCSHHFITNRATCLSVHQKKSSIFSENAHLKRMKYTDATMQERKLYLNLPKPNAWSLSLTTRPWVLFALIVERDLSVSVKRNPNVSYIWPLRIFHCGQKQLFNHQRVSMKLKLYLRLPVLLLLCRVFFAGFCYEKAHT